MKFGWHVVRAAGIVVGVLAGMSSARAQNPINQGMVKCEMYAWNRVTDFGDMFRIHGCGREAGDFFAGIAGLDPAKDDQSPDPTYMRKPARQLGRGVSNLVTGIWEVPLNVHQVNQEQGGVAALTYGLFRGMWRWGVRECTGVVEIVTFPFGWEAIIEPEFPFEPVRSTDWRVNEVPFTPQE